MYFSLKIALVIVYWSNCFAFFILRAHQSSLVIQCHIYPCRKTVVVAFNQELGDKHIYAFLKCLNLKENVRGWLDIEIAY